MPTLSLSPFFSPPFFDFPLRPFPLFGSAGSSPCFSCSIPIALLKLSSLKSPFSFTTR